jgi:hypothetical protein
MLLISLLSLLTINAGRLTDGDPPETDGRLPCLLNGSPDRSTKDWGKRWMVDQPHVPLDRCHGSIGP